MTSKTGTKGHVFCNIVSRCLTQKKAVGCLLPRNFSLESAVLVHGEDRDDKSTGSLWKSSYIFVIVVFLF